MSEENIASSRRVLDEAFSQGNLDVIDEVCAEGYVDHDPIMGDQSADAVKETISSYRAAFPDLSFTVDDIFAAGDKVVTRWTGSGTFENEFMGQAPSGEKGDPVSGIGIDRYEGGKIVESWGQWDTLGFMRNIGAIPDTASAAASS
jgi:predicted ester cyclase